MFSAGLSASASNAASQPECCSKHSGARRSRMPDVLTTPSGRPGKGLAGSRSAPREDLALELGRSRLFDQRTRDRSARPQASPVDSARKRTMVRFLLALFNGENSDYRH
jgi:hypothetical protein